MSNNNSVKTKLQTRYHRVLFLFCCTILSLQIFSQTAPFNFNHITTSDGLANGVIRSVSQDKYGYIWIGTLYGLCRYNGYSIKVFYHSDKDSFSIPENYVVNIFCDASGILWVSFANVLCRYDEASGHFIKQKAFDGLTVYKMKQYENGKIYCRTSKGIAELNVAAGAPRFLAGTVSDPSRVLLQKFPSDFFITPKGLLYITTDTGLIIFDSFSKKARLVNFDIIKDKGINNVAVDKSGNTWLSFGYNGGELVKADSTFTRFEMYPQFQSTVTNNHITFLYVDRSDRLWVGSSSTGLCLYNSKQNNFSFYGNDPIQPWSISSFNTTCVFRDKDGNIWTGSEGYGVNFFNPDESLFHTILPHYDPSVVLSDSWSRAVAEDDKGNLWLGGVTGISRFNTKKDKYDLWKSNNAQKQDLYANSVRSLVYDAHKNLWIGTSNGLNRYNVEKNKMEFFASETNIPFSFFWTLLEDHNKDIWIGCRDGLYRYSYGTNKFDHFEKDSLLAPFNHYNFLTIFEDSKRRIWLGTYKMGLIMYDPASRIVKHWMRDEKDPAFINNNVRSIAEDKNGIIWFSTNEGIAGYDERTNSFEKFTGANGLPTQYTCELMVDKSNRLWIGSGKGLFVLDSARNIFKTFSLKDGLSTLEFNEQSAFKVKNGKFIYPTLNGFLAFNPADFKNKISPVAVYTSSFKVFNQTFVTNQNPEALKELRFKNDQNYFTIELTALHFKDPAQITYAYKLEPFDKNWIYSKERLANYTNVPGGNYVFHYKATADEGNWSNSEKTLLIHIDTVFYKAIWFWLMVAIVILLVIYLIAKNRIVQREKMYLLQAKAQALEKEKAVVQYESLKQQLNPHFLFNSLTSLRSLIRINKQNAADFVDKMAISYRYILKSSESEIVPLSEEIAFVQTYIDLQQTRFDKGLQVSISINDDVWHRKIVPVTLQNLIENSIKHNLIDSDEPLMISIFSEDKYVVVQNNLQLKEHVETSNKYGLKNLVSLYKFLDKRPIIIQDDGIRFTIKIPLI